MTYGMVYIYKTSYIVYISVDQHLCKYKMLSNKTFKFCVFEIMYRVC